VLFLDLGGYTELSETVEAEKLNFFIEMYFSSFLDDIQTNRGDINETAGDSFMVIFQDEDPCLHALNAVHTGLSIQKKVQKINQDLEGHLPPFIVNVGINSGNALVGSTLFEGVGGTRLTYTASGPVTNVAARIAQLASKGEIFVAEDTALRVRDQITLKDRGPQKLKNVGEPIRVFEVLEAGKN
jgi:class 3 adenylate cyclase